MLGLFEDIGLLQTMPREITIVTDSRTIMSGMNEIPNGLSGLKGLKIRNR